MGEIDTKPIESVQSALSFFGQQTNDHTRRIHTSKDQKEVQKERDLESLEKDLANFKLQLEAKEYAYKQALVEIDHHQNTAHELSILLITTDFQKDFYISECREAHLRINELESAVNQMNLKALEIEREKAEVKEQLECTVKQVEIMEKQSIEKPAYISSLQLELNEANKLRLSSEKAAILEQNQLKQDLESQEKKNSDQTEYVSVLETELKQLKTEFFQSEEKENDVQVEIALLKHELHKGRSKLAAAEAAEVRVEGEKSALYNALQQMGLEAEEIKKENRALKEALKLADDETREIEGENTESEEISRNELIESVKKELEMAMAKIGELRTRSEQAISRAEAAERAKTLMEDEMKRRKERRERRKAALAALREESVSRDYGNGTSNDIVSGVSKSYQPLGKVLNMKF